MGLGDNAKASLITRGLAETTRLGLAMGARAQTFAGLAGMGDLVATCSSPLSRNHTFGTNLGRGMTLEETVAVTRQTAEGVKSCQSVLDLAQRHGVDMPITETVVGIVHKGTPPPAPNSQCSACPRRPCAPTSRSGRNSSLPTRCWSR
jgi:glycerol-3-phosphate dehydrogenase (NAD(P)+)